MNTPMKRFGLIGFPIEHSRSKTYFTDLFLKNGIDATYEAYALPPENYETSLPKILAEVQGLNITMPYKKLIIKQLDDIDEAAKQIDSVNVIKKMDGRWYGYNTDYIGFMQSFRDFVPADGHIKVLILGTGGVASAVEFGLKKLGFCYKFVSRTRKDSRTMLYSDVNSDVMAEYRVIVNCTPLGMSPSENYMPAIPYNCLTAQHFLFDCIYQPSETQFLAIGEKYGAKTKNGLQMFYIQAQNALKIWL